MKTNEARKGIDRIKAPQTIPAGEERPKRSSTMNETCIGCQSAWLLPGQTTERMSTPRWSRPGNRCPQASSGVAEKARPHSTSAIAMALHSIERLRRPAQRVSGLQRPLAILVRTNLYWRWGMANPRNDRFQETGNHSTKGNTNRKSCIE
jgi:hypothetical protein